MNKRIHIIGSIGSGKTTLAKQLSTQLDIPHFELDNIVWKRSNTGDIKRSQDERNEKMNEIINLDNWIIEGVHHKWVKPCFEKADIILFLDTKLSIRRFRIIKRFILQSIGCEESNYKPTFKLLKDLYTYNIFFEYNSKPEILNMLRPYENKLMLLNNSGHLEVECHHE